LGTYARFGARVPGSHPALVTNEDFQSVQERLNARRNNYAKRQPVPFLLASLVRCGDCGNKMIGVSRRQNWRRRSGAEGQASYRYYQCESRTNQGVCDYHTQRAEELEEHVRTILADLDGDALRPEAGDGAAVIAEWQAAGDGLRNRLKQIDRRLDEYLSVAAKGRISKEQLHKLGVTTAANRLAVEDELADIERKIEEQADASQRQRSRERTLAKLLDGWEPLPVAEKQMMLREIVDRVVVHDERLQLVLRP